MRPDKKQLKQEDSLGAVDVVRLLRRQMEREVVFVDLVDRRQRRWHYRKRKLSFT